MYEQMLETRFSTLSAPLILFSSLILYVVRKDEAVVDDLDRQKHDLGNAKLEAEKLERSAVRSTIRINSS
jgi:hypothetical protein